VDRYLFGWGPETTVRTSIDVAGEIVSEKWLEPSPPHVVAFEEILNVEFHEKRERQKTEPLRHEPVPSIMEEIEGGFEVEGATLEATRCFHCGHCTSCGCCVTDCPLYVLSMTAKGPEVEHFDECWHCGCCRIACPSGAVLYEFPLNMLV
jgi:NAD-dependent dihydropyrimidine dehydrogenase PreA subunit